jgi:hypothetical protein
MLMQPTQSSLLLGDFAIPLVSLPISTQTPPFISQYPPTSSIAANKLDGL